MKKFLFCLSLLLPVQLLLAQNSYKFKEAVPLNGAKEGNIRLEMPAGELNVASGSKGLLDATISYQKSDWKPSMRQSIKNGISDLTIKQQDLDNKENSGKNNWDININKNLPTNLYLEMGAGKSVLDLSSSQLQKLKVDAGAVSLDVKLSKSAVKEVDINAGVGEVTVDLTGTWDHSMSLDVDGGIGDIKLKLPKNTGVKLTATGLGSKTLTGLTKKNNYYANAALGKAKHTLTIQVTAGLGSISVVQE